MEFKLEEKGEACLLSQKTCSSSAIFTIPISKDNLVAAIASLLADPEQNEQIIADGAIMLEKQMSAGLVIHVGNGRFNVPWPYVFTLIA